MKRFVLPIIGVLAAAWAVFSVARTRPDRERTDPPTPPPVSDFSSTVAAVGIVEASTENISIGTPLSGVVTGVFVTAGQTVRAGQALLELDTRHLHAERSVRTAALELARGEARVAEVHLEDLAHQLDFVEQVTDKRAISAEEVTRRRSAVATAAAELDAARVRIAAAASQLHAVEVEIERSTVRSPIDAEVLQVKLRAGEYAPAGLTAEPLILLGGSKPLHVRVDVDEHEGWRVPAGARAMGHVRGNPSLRTPLRFVRFEPFVVPKRSLTGGGTERVDTRVLQVIYRVEKDDLPLFVGQQMDVFIDAPQDRAAVR